jgi:signal peptidase I
LPLQLPVWERLYNSQFICYPYFMALISNKPQGSKNNTKPKKSVAREWLDSFLFAVVVATFIRWVSMEAFTIPTSSMENSMLVGDFLFVSKLHYGARTPKTLLQIPLSHQRIWGTNIPSYLDWIQVPQFRLPGFSSLKRGDAVVFNYPHDEYPIDLKTYWVKRCVALAGDKIAVKDGQIFINGQAQPNPPQMQSSYQVTCKKGETINDRVFRGLNIVERIELQGNQYVVHTTAENAEKLKTLPFVQSVVKNIAPKDSVERGAEAFTKSARYAWNKDNLGEFAVPKAGETVTIDAQTIPLYSTIIEKYEGNENVKVSNQSLSINGKAITSYTFKQNYYFMMGDNRHNSLDSRFWGCVPEDHILGKALFIWMSVEQYPQQGDFTRITPEGGIFSRIRWNRLFTVIE